VEVAQLAENKDPTATTLGLYTLIKLGIYLNSIDQLTLSSNVNNVTCNLVNLGDSD